MRPQHHGSCTHQVGSCLVALWLLLEFLGGFEPAFLVLHSMSEHVGDMRRRFCDLISVFFTILNYWCRLSAGFRGASVSCYVSVFIPCLQFSCPLFTLVGEDNFIAMGKAWWWDGWWKLICFILTPAPLLNALLCSSFPYLVGEAWDVDTLWFGGCLICSAFCFICHVSVEVEFKKTGSGKKESAWQNVKIRQDWRVVLVQVLMSGEGCGGVWCCWLLLYLLEGCLNMSDIRFCRRASWIGPSSCKGIGEWNTLSPVMDFAKVELCVY